MRSLLFVTVLIAIRATGQEPAAAPVAGFSDGFKRLAALGMPPLDSKAKWSTLPSGAMGDDGGYYTQNALRPLKGNGWLIPGPDGKNQALPAAGVELTPLDAEIPDKPVRRELIGRTPADGSSPKMSAAIPEVDPAKDIAALIKHLNKEKSDGYSYSPHSAGTISGKLLLLATQFHQTGQSKLANELAQAALDFCPSREAALDSAVSTLADHAYKTATDEFFKSGDWAAYHKSLNGLATKFPRGWPSRPVVAIFLPQLEKQASGEMPPTPSLPGITLDPRALSAIQKLCELPAMRSEYGSGFYHSQSMWLLEAPEDSKDPKEAKKPTPFSEITALKTAALPALAALIDDPFLTHIPNPRASEGSSYYSSESERIQQLYQTINRPATRGEIAEMLLKTTLPESEKGRDSDALRDNALEFWKTHQNATRDELAAVFLREQSSSQVEKAAEILSTSTDPKAHQTLEAYILESDLAIAKYQIVQTYLRSRKSAGKSFLEAYTKIVRTQTAADPFDNHRNSYYWWQIKEAGGLEKALKQLESFLTEKSPRARAQEIAKGDPKDVEASIATLDVIMKDAPPTKRLDALLEGAITAEDPLIRYYFLNACVDPYERRGTRSNPSPKPDSTLSKEEIKVWRKLIADTRELPTEAREKSTLGNYAAATMEIFINPGDYQKVVHAAPILRKSKQEFIREWATARLDGKPLPILPDASRVTPERLRAIITEAGAKPAPEIHPYLNTLTPDERAAWQDWHDEAVNEDWRDEAGKIIPRPQSVKDLRSLVFSRGHSGPDGFSDVKGAGILDVGFVISPTAFKSYIESIAKDAARHSRTLIYIRPADFGPGLEVCAHVIPLSQKKSKKEFDERTYQPQTSDFFRESIKTLDEQKSAEAVIQIRLTDNAMEPEHYRWLIEKGRAKAIDPDQEIGFELMTDPEIFIDLSIRIQILTRDDAEKIRKL